MEIADYEFDYSDLVNRGFKEFNSNDKNFEDQHGFRDFSLQKKLQKGIYLTWEPLSRLVILERREKKHSIKSKMLVESLQKLDELISFFTEDSAKIIGYPEKVDYTLLA